MFILCHKCSGILARRKDDNAEGLSGCGCISGWIRGFEKELTRKEVVEAQLSAAKRTMDLYASQGRPDFCRDYLTGRIERLEKIQEEEGK